MVLTTERKTALTWAVLIVARPALVGLTTAVVEAKGGIEMIAPTIGRVMWYWPVKEKRQGLPMAAIVTWVWDENMVNLVVFDSNGNSSGTTSVPIVQDSSPSTAGHSPYVELIPYQKGQAKKHHG